VSRYVSQLHGLRDPGRTVVAAIGGPVTESSSGPGYDVVIGLDQQSNPSVQYSCTTTVDGAVPTIRLHNFVSAFNTQTDLDTWAFSPICSADYSQPLQGIGSHIGASF
jgi:hypothetical protein